MRLHSRQHSVRPELVEGLTFSWAVQERKDKAWTSSARTLILTAIVLTASACNPSSDMTDPRGAVAEKTESGGMGAPPALPPYQMRAERSASGGEALFSSRCGACHLAGGMGTNLLTKQMMMAKRPPGDGLLANRKDLTPDYVKTVVRQGKMAMPRLTKVDVTDAELDSIASYLGRAK